MRKPLLALMFMAIPTALSPQTLTAKPTPAVAPVAAESDRWPKEPEDFRGVKFGGDFDAEAMKGAGVRCFSSKPGSRLCSSSLMLGGVNIEMTFIFKSEKFVSVLLEYDSKDWDELKPILLERYGKPTLSSTSALTNAFGATFQNDEVAWSGARIHFQAAKYGSSLDKGQAGMTLMSYLNDFAKEQEEKRKKAADALK